MPAEFSNWHCRQFVAFTAGLLREGDWWNLQALLKRNAME